jgi:NSS family neurotransmitter:Na+ symporter
MILTVVVVVGGVRKGIERWTSVLMPLLFLLLILLAIRAVTLEGAAKGLEFYFQPDFSKVTLRVVLAAMGQAFFSLSLGMGAMITYGSYVSRKDDLVSSAAWVVGSDTLVAVLAGLIIFPTLFHSGLEPGQGGPGMVFVVLPSLLASMPPEPWGGIVFGTGFFLLLAIAGLTSSVSLLEVCASWLIDERGVGRHKAAILLGSIAFVIGIPSALANGAVGWLSHLPRIGMDFLSFLFLLFGQYSLVLGALLISIFIGWVWGIGNAGDEVRANDGKFPLGGLWSALIRYVCPVAIVLILGSLIWPYIAPLIPGGG